MGRRLEDGLWLSMKGPGIEWEWSRTAWRPNRGLGDRFRLTGPGPYLFLTLLSRSLYSLRFSAFCRSGRLCIVFFFLIFHFSSFLHRNSAVRSLGELRLRRQSKLLSKWGERAVFLSFSSLSAGTVSCFVLMLPCQRTRFRVSHRLMAQTLTCMIVWSFFRHSR